MRSISRMVNHPANISGDIPPRSFSQSALDMSAGGHGFGKKSMCSSTQLLRITNHTIEKMVSSIPGLLIPTSTMIVLQNDLKELKKLVMRATNNLILVPSIRITANDITSRLVDMVNDLVNSDDADVVNNFCEKEIKTFEEIYDKSRSLIKGQLLESYAQKVGEKLENVKSMQINNNVFEECLTALKALHSTSEIFCSAVTVKYSQQQQHQTSNIVENIDDLNIEELNSLLSPIERTIEFIQNLNTAFEHRKSFLKKAKNLLKNVDSLFLKLMEDVNDNNSEDQFEESILRMDDQNSPQNQDRRRKPKKFVAIPMPKHTPYTRPRLFEERRRVSAMSTRAERKSHS